MKTRLTEIAERLNMEYSAILDIAVKKLTDEQISGRGRGIWVTPDGVRELELAVEAPEVSPDVHYGRVLWECRNPSWNVVNVAGIGKRNVLIPPKLRGKLINKTIPVHAITDANGTTFRHADLL